MRAADIVVASLLVRAGAVELAEDVPVPVLSADREVAAQAGRASYGRALEREVAQSRLGDLRRCRQLCEHGRRRRDRRCGVVDEQRPDIR